jgi:hypothetical protein
MGSGQQWMPDTAMKRDARQSPATRGINTKAEESTALGAVTRRHAVKTHQTVKTWRCVCVKERCVVINFSYVT